MAVYGLLPELRRRSEEGSGNRWQFGGQELPGGVAFCNDDGGLCRAEGTATEADFVL